MAYQDEVPKATTTHTNTRTASSSATNNGAEANIIDNDLGTKWGIQDTHGSDGNAIADVTSEHTWTSAVTVDHITVKMYAKSHPHGNYEAKENKFKIELKVSGAWTTVYSQTYTGSGPGAMENTYNATISTGWDSVTGIRAYVYSSAYSYEGNRSQDAYADVYDVQAWVTVNRSYAGVV